MAAKLFFTVLVAFCAVQGLYALPDWMNKIKEEVTNVVHEVEESVQKTLEPLIEQIKALEDKVMKDMQDLPKIIKEYAQKVQEKIQELEHKIKEDINKLLSDGSKQLTALQQQGSDIGGCISVGMGQLQNIINNATTKAEDCVKQVETDMEPMMSDMEQQMSKAENILPQLENGVLSCIKDPTQFQQCLKTMGDIMSQVQSIGQKIGEDGKQLLTMMPNEMNKGAQCVSPIVQDAWGQIQGVISKAENCIQGNAAA